MVKGRLVLIFLWFISLLTCQFTPGLAQKPRTATRATVLSALQLAAATTPASCSDDNGTITLTAAGGVPPYTYCFSLGLTPFQNSRVSLSTGGQTMTVAVKDATGAIASATATVGYSIPPVIADLQSWTYPTGCAGNDGQVTIQGANGTPPYVYSMDMINYQPTGTFSNLLPGDYHFFVKDVNGCIGTTWFPIAPGNGSCPEQGYSGGGSYFVCNSGTVDMMPLGVPQPLTYSLDGVNFQSSPVFPNEPTGVYKISMKDGNNVLYLYMLYLLQDCPFNLIAVPTDATCGNNDGSVTGTVINGTAPYQYSIDGINFLSSGIFNGLSAGNYSLLVKDATGLLRMRPFIVNSGCLLSVTATVVNVACGNANGSITATGSGGIAPYTYSIDGSIFQNSNIFTGLGAAPYTVTARDFNNATATTTATITNSPGPILSVTTTPAACGNSDGSLTITAIGGTPPYQYSMDQINFQTSNVFSVPSGNYYYAYVKDANGCLFEQYPWVVGLDCVQANVTSKNASCANDDGSITITASGGTPPYMYSIDGINFQPGNIFTGLASGDYAVQTNDAGGLGNGQNISVGITCLSVALSTIEATCGKNNGTIIVNASGGTALYQYSIDGVNFQVSNTFASVGPGNFTVYVKDANNFTGTGFAIISNLPGPGVSATATAASCPNNDGSITVSGSGGTSPFSYSVDGVSYQNGPSFTGLPSGNYTATIMDNKGCIGTSPQAVTVPFTDNLNVNVSKDTTICQSSSAALNATSNGASFSWTPAAGLSDASSPDPKASPATTTTYKLAVTWGLCQQTASVIVAVNPAPVASAGPDTSICFGKTVQLTGSGGGTYAWSPATYLDQSSSADPVVNDPVAGSVTYHLQVTDQNGCHSLQDAHTTVTVIAPPELFAGDDTSVLLNQPIPLHAIDVGNSGFTQYEWSPVTGLNNPSIQNPVAVLQESTTYTVVGSTPGGCEGKASITIKAFSASDLFVPGAFTPNGDGHNDLLRVIAIGIKEFFYFAVYNRYGERVFYTTDPSRGWDGTLNGQLQNAGVYVWMTAGVNYLGKRIDHKGTVILIR